jgi:hypothetical protein
MYKVVLLLKGVFGSIHSALYSTIVVGSIFTERQSARYSLVR